MYLQPRRQLWVSITIALFMVLYFPVNAYAVQSIPGLSSPAQIDFNSLSKQVEQIETRDAYQLPAAELRQKIEQVNKDLEAYIKENQKDVEALILSVRLSFIEEIFLNNDSSNNEVYINPKEKFLAQHKRLDQALVLRPDSAEANYWKARLYGMNAPVVTRQGELRKQPIDLDKAIHFATQALLIDKKNAWYRETLAIYYVTAGDRKTALEVLDTNMTAYNPVNILLKDADGFPLPPGSVLSQEDSASYAELQLRNKTITNYPSLRVQVFVVPMAVAKLQEFYRGIWPQFKFFSQGREDLYAQYLLLDAEGARPSASISEARAWAAERLGGVILSVKDVKNATGADREETPAGHKLPAAFGENFSYVFYVNNRVVY